MNKFAVAVLAVAALATTHFFSIRFDAPGPVVWSEKFQDYDVRIYRAETTGRDRLRQFAGKLPRTVSSRVIRWLDSDPPEDAVEIRKKGKRIYWKNGSDFDVPEQWLGHDVTGRGCPNIFIRNGRFRNGGGRLDLFECREGFRQIAHVESLDFGPELQDLDDDGRPEIIVSDSTFYHRPICRDGTPMPKVILRWHDGEYIPAAALMRKAILSDSELAAKAASIRTGPEEDKITGRSWIDEMLSTTFTLFYSDNEEMGWTFLDDSWKREVEGKEEFAARLKGLLEESEYRAQLRDAWKSTGNQSVK
jgi:hypothetical protein